jgi:hypothetical protein
MTPFITAYTDIPVSKVMLKIALPTSPTGAPDTTGISGLSILPSPS